MIFLSNKIKISRHGFPLFGPTFAPKRVTSTVNEEEENCIYIIIESVIYSYFYVL